jgi:Raf kinase inhibitor-like YbhB/YbcL family protein
MRPLLLLALLAGCGNDSLPSTADAAIDAFVLDGQFDGPSAQFTLTSPTITDGGTFPLSGACTTKGGMNESPQLVFANAPAGTMSFAVVLTDLSNSLVHCAIYDVPGTATGLPANVDKIYAPTAVPGAHQTNNYSGTRGYAGPCPPNAHMYQFKVYALATSSLPNSTMSTTKEQLVTTSSGSNLGTATLTATFTP